MKRLLGILFLAIILVSCDPGRVYEGTYSFEDYAWHKDSVLVFKTDSLYDLPDAVKFEFNLRNTTEYKYRNLWVFFEIIRPNGGVIKDKVNLELMTKEGYWKENVEGSGGIKESKFTYNKGIAKPENGVYTIKIQHGMREEVLDEIVNVGPRIVKFGP